MCMCQPAKTILDNFYKNIANDTPNPVTQWKFLSPSRKLFYHKQKYVKNTHSCSTINKPDAKALTSSSPDTWGHGQGLQYLYPGYLQQYLMKWYFFWSIKEKTYLIFLSLFKAEQSWKGCSQTIKKRSPETFQKRSRRRPDGLRPGEEKRTFATFQKRRRRQDEGRYGRHPPAAAEAAPPAAVPQALQEGSVRLSASVQAIWHQRTGWGA